MLYLLKGHPAFSRPSRQSPSHDHGNALTNVAVTIIDSQKFYPWAEIRPISQEYMSLKIDPNYPDWFVDMVRDCSPEKPAPTPTPTPEPNPVVEVAEEDAAGRAFTFIVKWIVKLFKQ